MRAFCAELIYRVGLKARGPHGDLVSNATAKGGAQNAATWRVDGMGKKKKKVRMFSSPVLNLY